MGNDNLSWSIYFKCNSRVARNLKVSILLLVQRVLIFPEFLQEKSILTLGEKFSWKIPYFPLLKDFCFMIPERIFKEISSKAGHSIFNCWSFPERVSTAMLGKNIDRVSWVAMFKSWKRDTIFFGVGLLSVV